MRIKIQRSSFGVKPQTGLELWTHDEWYGNKLNLFSGCRRGHSCGVRNAVLAGRDGTRPVPTPAAPEDHQHAGEGAQTQPRSRLQGRTSPEPVYKGQYEGVLHLTDVISLAAADRPSSSLVLTARLWRGLCPAWVAWRSHTNGAFGDCRDLWI